jgi:hypothetical protein
LQGAGKEQEDFGSRWHWQGWSPWLEGRCALSRDPQVFKVWTNMGKEALKVFQWADETKAFLNEHSWTHSFSAVM